MKFVILGAGGVGGYLGARLAADGNEVVFVARGDQREAMEKRGLRLLSPDGDCHVQPVQLLDDPAFTGLCDAVFVCVTNQDTRPAVELVKPLLAFDSAVISLQQGINVDERLGLLLNSRFVVGGIATLSAEITEPGVVRQYYENPKLIFGELDGSESWRLDSIAAAFEGAGIETHMSTSIRSERWADFVLQSALAAVTCTERCTVGDVLADEGYRSSFKKLITEGIAAAQASGRRLDDNMFDRAQRLPADTKPAMLRDLERGRPLELEWLCGAVVRLGQEHGVATPAHEGACERILAAGACGRESAGITKRR